MTAEVVVGAAATVIVALIGFGGIRLSERRLTQHAQEERDRLRLDAAMRAATLFSTQDGSPSTAAAKAGALLALVELGHSDLAVTLLVDVWSRSGRRPPNLGTDAQDGDERTEPEPSEVSTETAILVINRALCDTGAPTAQLVAAELLCRNADRLQLCQSLHWPAAIEGTWIPTLGLRAKLLLMDALIQTSLASDPDENALRVLVLRLYGVSANDPDPRMKGCVGRLIDCVLDDIRELGYDEFLGPAGLVHLSELEAAAALASPNPDGYLERQLDQRGEYLKAWVRRCKRCTIRPGSLIPA